MTDHYFTPHPAAASSPRSVSLALTDGVYRFATDTGVFSHGAVDAGTRLLLRTAPPPPPDVSGDIADVGCGYGPIAVVTAARNPTRRVWAIDVNERALALTAENAATAGHANVHTASPSDVPAGVQLAAIYSNPPIKVGKDVLHGLLTTWLGRLAPRGIAYLVVHKHLGSDSLTRWLSSRGWPVERLASSGGYRVLAVSKSHDSGGTT